MSAFETILEVLRNIGFFDIFLPLLLIWALVYGILIRLEFFKKGNEVDTKLSSLVALSIALIAVGSYQILRLLQIILPYIGLVVVTIFGIIMVAGFTGGVSYEELMKMSKRWKALLGGGTAAAVFLWLLYVLGFFNPSAVGSSVGSIPQELLEMIVGFVMLGIFFIVVWWLTKPEKKEQKKQQQSS